MGRISPKRLRSIIIGITYLVKDDSVGFESVARADMAERVENLVTVAILLVTKLNRIPLFNYLVEDVETSIFVLPTLAIGLSILLNMDRYIKKMRVSVIPDVQVQYTGTIDKNNNITEKLNSLTILQTSAKTS